MNQESKPNPEEGRNGQCYQMHFLPFGKSNSKSNACSSLTLLTKILVFVSNEKLTIQPKSPNGHEEENAAAVLRKAWKAMRTSETPRLSKK